jgi:Ser/Thr protein kinase RdoA (MazF antagonist)
VDLPAEHLNDVVRRFSLPGAPACERYGSGLINDTWRCVVGGGGATHRYILQRINGAVFPRPDLVMENIETVTAHLRQRLERTGAALPDAQVPIPLRTRDGRSFLRDAHGAYWRMFPFIEEGMVFDAIQGPAHAHEVGRCLGRFHALVADLPPDRMHDTLPGFHHTPAYLEDLRAAARSDTAGRAADVRRELDLVEARTADAAMLLAARDSGRIPVRVVHNDPKVNNIMIDRVTGRALCMLDLDTVKPGIVHFDFGDCVRSTANPAGEDADPGDVEFDGRCYEAIREGYLQEASDSLTSEERALLPLSVRIITFELGVRFLADHLRGDRYFRTVRSGQNLHRARVQFRLLERMEQAGIG